MLLRTLKLSFLHTGFIKNMADIANIKTLGNSVSLDTARFLRMAQGKSDLFTTFPKYTCIYTQDPANFSQNVAHVYSADETMFYRC